MKNKIKDQSRKGKLRDNEVKLKKVSKRKLEDMEDVALPMDPRGWNRDPDLNIDHMPKQSSSKKKGIIKKHQDELDALQAEDPDFYKYLKENDAELLEFGLDGEESDVEEDEEDLDVEDELKNIVDSDDDEETEEKSKKKKKGKQPKSQQVISEELVRRLMKSALDGSFTAMKKILTIFRVACSPMTNTDDEDHVNYAIDSPDLYEFVMTHIIGHAHAAFYRYLDVGDISKFNSDSVKQHPKWKTVQLLVLSYFKSALHTLSSLADNEGHGQVAVLLISSLENYIPLVGSLPRLAKKLLKVLLIFWSKDESSEVDNFNMRGHALLRIRQMAMKLPGTIPEECFRSTYLAFARTCKTFTESSAAGVLFMAQSIVELYLCDLPLAYQQTFLHIRQLALMTRVAILKKTSESVRQITNWQFLNCIRLWTRMICALPGTDELGALAFPLTQIMFGVMSMATSLYYVPLRYHLITCIHQLVASCRLYIPVAMKLFEVLESTELYSKFTPSTSLPPNFTFLVKLSSDLIDTASARDVIVHQTIALLRQDIELYRYNISFPEYSFLISRKLRQCSKKCKISKWRDQMKPLISQVDNFLQYAKEKRLLVGLPPAQVSDFEVLLPKNTSDVKERLTKLLKNSGHFNATSEVPASVSSIKKSSEESESKPKKKKAKKSAEVPKEQSFATNPTSSLENLPDELGELNWIDEE